MTVDHHYRERRFVGLSLAFATVLLVSLAAGDDWPQWHGPNRDDKSKETGLLKEWPTNGPPLAWKAKDLGGGFSSIAVAAGRIYTLGDFSDGCHALAFEENGGKQIWSTRIGDKGGGEGHPGPRCTPTVDGDLLYAIGQFGDVVCLEAATGKEVWHKNLNSNLDGRMMSGWGNSESPLVDGDRLICTPGGPKGTLLALNKKTGETLWRSAEVGDAASYSSALVTEIGGVRQYVQLTDRHLFAVAADNGKLLWAAPRNGKTAVVPTPIVSGDLIFVTSGYGVGCNLFKITSDNGDFKTAEVYHNKDMVNHHGGVVLVGDDIYGYSDHGHFTCMDFKTGHVVWTDKNAILGKGSLTYADGEIYYRNESGEGTIWLVAASPDGFKDQGHFNPPDRSKSNSWPHPVVANGKLYIRDQDVLLCYDVKGK